MPSISKIRVCCIGAGPSGLALLKSFQHVDLSDVEVVCYEKQNAIGGLWNFNMDTGLDNIFKEPVTQSMYRYLWSNGPKEALEFADYSFEEHFGKPIPSYPPRPVLENYIRGRIEKNGLDKFVKLNSNVRNISFDVITQKFTVSIHRDGVYNEVFDYVVVASGHFSYPNIPDEMISKLNCDNVIHATDFRDALLYKDKRVLIIGSSYSAEDIASQCYKYGAKSIIISHRNLTKMGYTFPNNWKELPQVVKSIDRNIILFEDDSIEEIDAVILCTGYKHHFPFLPDHLKLATDNRLWVSNLYKGVVSEINPRLFFIGMQDQYYTFNMFDAQAWIVRDFILQKIEIPSLHDMQLNDLQWSQYESKIQNSKDAIVFQGDYIKDILKLSDYPTFDVDAINDLFFKWKEHKKEDFINYRDYSFKSVMTGTQAPIHHTKWIDAMSDSIESFLN